jgi:hypothetical protein
MTDTATGRPIRVIAHPSGPYIDVSVQVLEHVRKILVENTVPHWVEHHQISVNGGPRMTRINVGRKVDPRQVQDVLDAAAEGALSDAGD